MPERAQPHVIGGGTQAFALLGHPVRHTLSPVMQNAALRAMGLDAVYLAFDVPSGGVREVLRAMRTMGFGGVNITVPLKIEALEAVDERDPTAELLGAVNTVAFRDGRLIGFNTDGVGFLAAFEEAFGRGVAGERFFVLGAGGAGRAVALTCAQAGAASVRIADVDGRRAEHVAGELRKSFPSVEVSVCADRAAWPREAAQVDAVIQATPVGMHAGDSSPLPSEAFRAGARAFDLVYTSVETPFVAAARRAGAEAVNGLGMLLHQGVRALAVWTGITPPVEVMRAALEDAVYGA